MAWFILPLDICDVALRGFVIFALDTWDCTKDEQNCHGKKMLVRAASTSGMSVCSRADLGATAHITNRLPYTRNFMLLPWRLTRFRDVSSNQPTFDTLHMTIYFEIISYDSIELIKIRTTKFFNSFFVRSFDSLISLFWDLYANADIVRFNSNGSGKYIYKYIEWWWVLHYA